MRKYKSRMSIWYRASKSYNYLVKYKMVLRKTTQKYKKGKRDFEMKLAKNIKVNLSMLTSEIMLEQKIKLAH